MTDTSDPILQFISENLIALITLTLSVFIFPLLLSYIERKYWSPLARKKNVWRSFIGKSNSIKECFERYSSIEKRTEISPSISVVLYFSISIYFFSQALIVVLLLRVIETRIVPFIQDIPILGQYYGNNDFAFSILGLIVLFLSSIPLIAYLKWMETTIENVNFNNLNQKYHNTKLLYQICLFLALFYAFFTLTFIQESSYFFVAFLAIPFFIIKHAYSSKKASINNIKHLVNDKYSPHFPYVKVTTMGAEHCAGKVKNVFDKESIRLTHNKKETIILWDAVATISETNESEELQKQLSSFFN